MLLQNFIIFVINLLYDQSFIFNTNTFSKETFFIELLFVFTEVMNENFEHFRNSSITFGVLINLFFDNDSQLSSNRFFRNFPILALHSKIVTGLPTDDIASNKRRNKILIFNFPIFLHES